MYSVNENTDLIEIILSSEFHLVDRAINDVVTFIKTHVPDADKEDFRLVLREVINNAVEHGNQKDPSKNINVLCERLEDHFFKVTTRDEGEGFDANKINYEIPLSPDANRSRGFPLISKLSESLEFNEIGNEVIFYYRFPHESAVKVVNNYKGSKDITIIPENNITSSTSSNIKKQLIEILDQKPLKVTIDFKNVREFDSIGLSLIAIFGKKLKESNPNVEIVINNARIEIIQLFLHTGLDKYFELF